MRVGAALGVYAGWVEPRRLVVRDMRLALPRWPAALAGLRVGVLTDLHAGVLHAGEDAIARWVRADERRGARPGAARRRLHRRALAVRPPPLPRADRRAPRRARGPARPRRRAGQPRLEGVRPAHVDRARRRRDPRARERRDRVRRPGRAPARRRARRRPLPPPERRARARRHPGARARDRARPRPRRVPVRAGARRAHRLRPHPRRPGGDPLRCAGRSCPRATASASPAGTSSSTAATSWSAPGSARAASPIRLLAPPELLVLELHPEER